MGISSKIDTNTGIGAWGCEKEALKSIIKAKTKYIRIIFTKLFSLKANCNPPKHNLNTSFGI